VTEEDLGLVLQPGGDHYRAYVGPPQDYDLVAAMAFGLLCTLGLRQQHRVLDLGCGSLRVGRLLIPYLNRGGYTGLDPHAWLVEQGIQREVGEDQVRIKQPHFVHAEDATSLLQAGETFDYVLAQSIFSHCGPDLLEQWLRQSWQLLSEAGALVATYVAGNQNCVQEGWIYPDCVTYTEDTIIRLGSAHGFRCIPLNWRHPRQRWMLFAKPGFDIGWLGQDLSWNIAFDHFQGRMQTA
jgi:SAM-dependent methyltransferase